MVRVLKRVFYSPWLYLIIIPPLVFYLALVLTFGFGNGWLAWGLTVAVTAGIVWLGIRNRTIRSIRTVFVVLVALVPTVVAGYLCIPLASTTYTKAADFSQVATQYWDLPTGSRIAYYHLAANKDAADSSKPAIVYLHGGPGGSVASEDVAFFSQFAQLGYNTYLYDQAGGGRSDFLPVKEYSNQRNIDDLAAILNKIPQEKVVLVGHSYGGVLLTSAVTDPRIAPRVAKAVFAEPGGMPLEEAEMKEFYAQHNIPEPATVNPRKASEDLTKVFMKPRILLGQFYLPQNNNFVTQAELSNILTPERINNSPQGMVCPENYEAYRAQTDDSGLRLNLKANVAISKNGTSFDLKKFGESTIPGMLMLGECSYMLRQDQIGLMFGYTAMERVQYYKGYGHALFDKEKESLPFTTIRAFIEDTPSPLPNYPTKAEAAEFVKADN